MTAFTKRLTSTRRAWGVCWLPLAHRVGIDLLTPHGRLCMAEARAMKLLYENLSTEQRDMLRSLGYFEVIGGETGRTYRIRSAYRMNVEGIGARGTRMYLMCFCPNGRVGLGDIMLAQKLALELFEHDALAVANIAASEFGVVRRLDNRSRTALRARC